MGADQNFTSETLWKCEQRLMQYKFSDEAASIALIDIIAALMSDPAHSGGQQGARSNLQATT